AGLHADGAAVRPTFGRGFVAELAQLLAHGVLFTAQPCRQERTDGGQCTGARQHHTETPQCQYGGLGLGQMGQMGLNGHGPFGHTGVARHRYPPWGYGINAISHTMPYRGVSCHLYQKLTQERTISPATNTAMMANTSMPYST